MPYDDSIGPLSTAPRVRRAASRRVTLGVFSDTGQWKVYSEFGKARPYPTRQQAMQAGYALATEARDAGATVQMFVQDEDGSFDHLPVERGGTV